MRSSGSAMAVSSRMGVRRVRRSAAVKSKPFSPGIMTSSTTRSNSRLASLARASTATTRRCGASRSMPQLYRAAAAGASACRGAPGGSYPGRRRAAVGPVLALLAPSLAVEDERHEADGKDTGPDDAKDEGDEAVGLEAERREAVRRPDHQQRQGDERKAAEKERDGAHHRE